MMRTVRAPLKQLTVRALAGLLSGLLAGAQLACGARDIDAPPPQRAHAEIVRCRSFEELMPRFKEALSTGRTEGLRKVMQQHLLQGEREGEPPPMATVLRAVFGTLARFAREPAEPGAAQGEVCASPPPPVSGAHPMCEMRRAMDLLVHEGRGLEALGHLDPQVAGILNYIRGKSPAARKKDHYEVAQVFSDLCQQTVQCRVEDTADLVLGLTAYLGTPEGKDGLDRALALVKDPRMEPYLRGDGAQYGGEDAIVALAKLLMDAVKGMEHPDDLDNIPLDLVPEDLRPLIRQALADLKVLLDPAREPNVFRPLKRGLNCLNSKDKNNELVRMVYRLGLDARLPEFGFTRMLGTAVGLRETDGRGSLLHLTSVFARTLRNDDQALGALARVCHTLFSTRAQPGELSPAQLALPDVAELFERGVAGEALCAVDTLVYGCAGGAQPACELAR
jgi:hypothetical protein